MISNILIIILTALDSFVRELPVILVIYPYYIKTSTDESPA